MHHHVVLTQLNIEHSTAVGPGCYWAIGPAAAHSYDTRQVNVCVCEQNTGHQQPGHDRSVVLVIWPPAVQQQVVGYTPGLPWPQGW